MQSLVKQVIAKHKQMQKEKGIDRAKNAAMTFGVIKELHSITDMLFSKGDYISMRTRMDLMLTQTIMLCGEDRQNAKFLKLFTIESINEGPKSNVQLLCLRLVSSKVCFNFSYYFFGTSNMVANVRRPIKRENYNMALLFITSM